MRSPAAAKAATARSTCAVLCRRPSTLTSAVTSRLGALEAALFARLRLVAESAGDARVRVLALA